MRLIIPINGNHCGITVLAGAVYFLCIIYLAGVGQDMGEGDGTALMGLGCRECGKGRVGIRGCRKNGGAVERRA